MRDDDDVMERAYSTAVESLSDESERAAAARRRRAVLEAVSAMHPRPAQPAAMDTGSEPAANQRRCSPVPGWWRTAAAACVLVSSTLVVVHLQDDTGAGVKAVEASTPSPAVNALPPVPSPPPVPPESLAAPARRAAAVRAAPPAAPRLDSVAPPDPALAPATATPSAFPGNDGPLPAPPPPAVPAAPPALARAVESAAAPDAAPAPRARAEAPQPGAAADTALASRAARLANSAKLAVPDSLLSAVARGDAAATERTLAHTHPDAERDADGRTALALAVMRADARLVKLLLDKGASPLAADRFGQTPRAYAQAGGNQAVLQAFGNP